MDEKEAVKKKLIEELKTISKDEEFLLSIINLVQETEDRKSVIAYIKRSKAITYEDLILLALTIYEKREKIKQLSP